MDKKSIIGIAVVAVLFLGFAYFNSQQQKEYLEQKAAYEAYVDSVAAAARAAAPVADSLASGNGVQAEVAAAEAAAAVRERQVETLGESLTAAREAEAEEFIVENDVMAVLFSTRGGQIKGVTLKDYTQYGPRGKRDRKIEMMDPATARFGLSFYLKNGLKNVPVNTLDYVFTAQPVVGEADGAKSVVMRLPVAEGAYLEYRYLIYDTEAPERDYLVDFDVRLVNMAPEMANQTQIQIDWANTTFQNEKGFQNENMYTTLSYRFPDETSIEELGMSEGAKSKNISTQVNWVAFKQQFFSSVFIAPDNVSYANLAFDTAAPESSLLKTFTAQMGVPYTPQTEGYDFAFYFGPNKYSILKKIGEPGGADIYLERLVPLGWGIFGWVNRWCVIPVFDFLRNYIASFGIVILILAVLIRLVISPLTYKSYVSMAKMRLVKPQIDELAKKYPKPEDAMKKQQATMELYKKAGINPMGGCIPMLIQMPILIAMFRFFPASIELREQPFLWADEPAVLDSLLRRSRFAVRPADGGVAVRILLVQLPADGVVAAPDGRHEVYDGLHDADYDALLVQQLFERPLLLLPAVEYLHHRADARHPAHGRRQQDPRDHAGERREEVERQEIEIPAALRGADASAGGPAAREEKIGGTPL